MVFNEDKIGLFVTSQVKSSLLFSEASLSLLTFENHTLSTSVFSRGVLDIRVFWKNQVVGGSQDEEAGVVAASSRLGQLSAVGAHRLWQV